MGRHEIAHLRQRWSSRVTSETNRVRDPLTPNFSSARIKLARREGGVGVSAPASLFYPSLSKRAIFQNELH